MRMKPCFASLKSFALCDIDYLKTLYRKEEYNGNK